MVRRALCIVALLTGSLAVGGCGTDRDESGNVTEEGSVSVFDLRVGDCLKGIGAARGEQRSIEAAPCAQPHEGEVYTNIDLGDGAFPGAAFIKGKADRGCSARLRRQAPQFQGAISYFTPTKRSWDEQDDHSVTCIAVYPKPQKGTIAAQNDGS